jgi:hypothetical protein
MEDLIKRLEIPDVALFTLTSEDGYLGMEKDFETRAWWGVVAADVMEDIRSMILANAVDTVKAEETFETEWQAILAALEKGVFSVLEEQLVHTAGRLHKRNICAPGCALPSKYHRASGRKRIRHDMLTGCRMGFVQQLHGGSRADRQIHDHAGEIKI